MNELAHPQLAGAVPLVPDVEEKWILTLSCADRLGIVAGVASFLADNDCFITDSQQFADLETQRFFMRVEFAQGGPRFPRTERQFRDAFAAIADQLWLDWNVHQASRPIRVVVAVSKATHCLQDLLYRWRSGTLPVEIAAVLSNRDEAKPLCQWYRVPFYALPPAADARAEREAEIRDSLGLFSADLLVLARYMQILSAELADELLGRCINIHHSFLPSFKGADPYRQAHAKGVKLIGATAHFVTAALDEGPIIEQAVERIDHRAGPEELGREGRDIEAQVLARAVKWFAEHRVFIDGGRTVVFR